MFTFGPPDQIIRRYDTIPGCRCPIHWSFRSIANRRRSKWKSFAENLCGSASDQSLLKLDYTYGVVESGTLNTAKNNGNIQSQTITVQRSNQDPLVLNQSYVYDSLNRLLSAEEIAGGSTVWKQTYLFDRYGNRRFDQANTSFPASFSNTAVQIRRSTLPTIGSRAGRVTHTTPLGTF